MIISNKPYIKENLYFNNRKKSNAREKDRERVEEKMKYCDAACEQSDGAL